ncbi:hypothetical protein TcCL_Unassigned03230, partial [Trypanosoma cruzi]
MKHACDSASQFDFIEVKSQREPPTHRHTKKSDVTMIVMRGRRKEKRGKEMEIKKSHEAFVFLFFLMLNASFTFLFFWGGGMRKKGICVLLESQ